MVFLYSFITNRFLQSAREESKVNFDDNSSGGQIFDQTNANFSTNEKSNAWHMTFVDRVNSLTQKKKKKKKQINKIEEQHTHTHSCQTAIWGYE